ncbi:hypothetical protein ACS0TY_014826 [Phlomoides rotata]
MKHLKNQKEMQILCIPKRKPGLKLHKMTLLLNESANTLPNLATGQAFDPKHETSSNPPTKIIQHASSEDDAATIGAIINKFKAFLSENEIEL